MKIIVKDTIKFVYPQDHGTADMYEETESILISKQGIPYPHNIRQGKLLRKEQCQPSNFKHGNNDNNKNYEYDNHRYIPKAIILRT